jgi:hypothetical protein
MDQNHTIQIETNPGQNLVAGLGLGQSAGVTIQNESLGPVVPGKALGDQVIDHLVGNQMPLIHMESSFTAGGSTVAHRLPQQITSADMLGTQPLAQNLGLGSFATSGRSEENETHARPPKKAV